MNGQWIGRYNGSNSGIIVIDLDDAGTHYEGYAYVWDDNLDLPSTHALVKTTNKSTKFSLKVQLAPIDQFGSIQTWDVLSNSYAPGTTFPKTANVELELSDNKLSVKWKTDIGTFGSAILPKSTANETSDCKPLENVTTWDEFKSYVNKLDFRRYIFRGQDIQKRLRTAFHRTGRADLHKFLSEDRNTLHRHLSQRTSHIFDLAKPEQNGAFFNLVQHHGYPTPLLDWTYSPYVSAFFAYRSSKVSDAADAAPEKKVRIFMFDQKEWRDRLLQSNLLAGRLHFSIMEFIAIDNERLVPQQSVSSVTNVDDIERFILGQEKSFNCKFLTVIDLPLSERARVMQELSTMGITAGSMFPGLDGACEEIKERLFRFG